MLKYKSDTYFCTYVVLFLSVWTYIFLRCHYRSACTIDSVSWLKYLWVPWLVRLCGPLLHSYVSYDDTATVGGSHYDKALAIKRHVCSFPIWTYKTCNLILIYVALAYWDLPLYFIFLSFLLYLLKPNWKPVQWVMILIPWLRSLTTSFQCLEILLPTVVFGFSCSFWFGGQLYRSQAADEFWRLQWMEHVTDTSSWTHYVHTILTMGTPIKAWKLLDRALPLHGLKQERWWNYCQLERTEWNFGMKEYTAIDNETNTISYIQVSLFNKCGT